MIKIENPRTRKILELLSVLAAPLPNFLQPWELEKWEAEQEEAFIQLYRTYQDNPRVLKFLAEVDGGSRSDARIIDAVMRARKIAGRCMNEVLADLNSELFAPESPKTGDPVTDFWLKDSHVERSDGLSNEWGRTAARERNKGIEYETDFRGYVAEKR